MDWFVAVLYLLGFVVVVATVLPVWRTTRWWGRLADFPRFQIGTLAIAILALVPTLKWPSSLPELLLLVSIALAAAWQLSWVWHYVRGAPIEVPSATELPSAPQCFALFTTNVLQSTRDANSLLHLISTADPDLVLGVETDEWWCSQLNQGLRTRYPHAITYPLSNGYGLALFSRLELVNPTIRFLVDEAIPSIKTGVRLRSNSVIDLYGVHPQPPSVQQDSAERDLELLLVGKEISRCLRPAVVVNRSGYAGGRFV